ncbi:hypothetical protein BAUCODRAFT_32053 [Baudoinia panamericana UAMH 10762]|uniref:2-dehydropantoate 2-reductase n=1 Tax=Baudoinia panamericana (strain UAMH 10762) TaxID=717646 RepID=M2N2B0_BAUPA|nr:uncharacterized protein BAUCODRAFT_32053 [Baudoinia panamericana UAMH 10762]EMC98048.1 hypothetical protein BAUCODRAFT_32053 [Baudoinia panamericana UAMH 10762]
MEAQTTGGKPTWDEVRDKDGGMDNPNDVLGIDAGKASQANPPESAGSRYATRPDEIGDRTRIHLLGTGAIGKLVAHSLRGVPNPPPITLILHRYRLLEAWQKGKKVITIQDGNDENIKVARGGFDVELMAEVRQQHGVTLSKTSPDVYDLAGEEGRPHEVAEQMKALQQQEAEERVASQAGLKDPRTTAPDARNPSERTSSTPAKPHRYYQRYPQAARAISSSAIDNLIVTVKAPQTIAALSAIAHRLNQTSTICFLQNGLGIVDEMNDKLFPDIATRPNYIQGVITHGANTPPHIADRDPFFAIHAGHGTIALSPLPKAGFQQSSTPSEGKNWGAELSPTTRYLMRALTRTPVLCAVGFTPTELLQQQLEKLAVNSVLNPLTAVLDARNGSLLYNLALTRTMRMLLAETSLVMRSLPELQNIPNVNQRFSAERLEHLVVGVANRTQDNISSMLADVRAGRRTEIDYINGYIVRRGEELGIKCVVNYAIMQTVLGKALMTNREARDAVPMERDLNAET